MRILVAHQVSPARTGGMSRLMGFIHDELAASEGWQTEYFCADRLPAGVGEPWSRAVFPWLLIRYLRAALRRGEPFDVVNVHEPHAGLVVAARRLLGEAKIVVTSHGLEVRAWELERAEARLGRRRVSWKSRVARGPTILWPSAGGLRGADHVFCLNETDAAQVIRRYGRRRTDLTRLCPGAGPVFLATGVNREHRDVSPRGGRLLFAGTWRPNKGIADLVAAFSRVLATRPDARLTVLGAGVPAPVVRADLGAGAAEQVEVVQARDEAEAAAILAEHDVFWLPSLFEGTPLTLLEAMAAGLPVVTTATCGMLDVVRDRENGRLVPIRDPGALTAVTLDLLSDPVTRAQIGRAAHETVQRQHTWAQAAGPVLTAYRKLVSQPGIIA